MYDMHVPLPAGMGTATVVGTWLDPNGDPATGRVTLTPTPEWIVYVQDAIGIVPTPLVEALDVNGSVSFTVPATDDVDVLPNPFTYRVLLEISGIERRFFISAPEGETIDLPLLLEAPPSECCSPGGTLAMWRHPLLQDRDLPDQHPSSAITHDGVPLDVWLDTIGPSGNVLNVDGGDAFAVVLPPLVLDGGTA